MIDLNRIKPVSIRQRKNKVKLSDLVKPEESRILMDSAELSELAKKVAEAHKNSKHVIFGMGAHVIKVGMSLLVIDLMKKGIIKHLATNGAGSIHDFELAFFGETSEYVERTNEDGTFGLIDETCSMMNVAINSGYKNGYGMGYAIGKYIDESDFPNKKFSILYNAYKLGIPATVHVAIGTDIIHMHPNCSGAALGATTYSDFMTYAESTTKLEGGIVLNVGSAVLLPEVFLKTLTIARNLGYKVEDITAANLDMINHYRPRENVVTRPTSLGGKGYIIIERHEKTIPTLHRMIVDSI